VFLAAWRGIRDLRSPERVLPWLRQLTRNRAREMLRTRLRRDGYVHPRSAGVADLITTVPDPGPSPVDAIIAAEDRAAKSATVSAMTAAIATLPATSRQVLLLHYGAQRSAPEVARQLDVSADAVRQRLARARARLRAALGTTALGSDARPSARATWRCPPRPGAWPRARADVPLVSDDARSASPIGARR
jgi:RNA polymerase sigma factor (sigma-70 family)